MFSIALTGGKSAKEIYSIWGRSSRFKNLTGIDFFLTDERCVPIESSLSNAGMIYKTLFNGGIPLGSKFHAPINRPNNVADQVLEYDKKIPRNIDIVIVTVGDDGHIASIFPNSKVNQESENYFIQAVSPVPPAKRVTLSLKAILNANKVYILATNNKKKELLQLVSGNDFRFDNLPIKKIIHNEWITENDPNKVAEYLLESIIYEINNK